MQQKPPNFYRHNELNDMNRERRKQINSRGALILLVIMVVGLVIFFMHGLKSNQLTLPSSAKTISPKTIQVPFPYIDSQNRDTWKLIGSNQNKILKITNNGKAVVDIPLSNNSTAFYVTKLGNRYVGGYKYNTNTTIQLGNKVYTIIEIDLNSDNTSGKVILKVNS